MKNILYLIFGGLFCLTLNAQNFPTLVKKEWEGTYSDENRKFYLSIFDYNKNDYQLIYQVDKFDMGISEIKVSSNNKYIAFVLWKVLSKEEWEKTRKIYTYKLIIIDEQGKIIHTIDRDVQELAWHPNGEIVAYIIGRYYEGGIGFIPEGIYYFNLKTGKEKKIEGIRHPHALQWIKGDGSAPLFIRDLYPVDGKRIVYKYDFKKEELKPTDHKNINFSPDGKYYLQYSGEEFDNFAVFETATDKEITAQLPAALQREFHWAFDTKHYAIQSENQQLYIYDVETKQIVETLEGKQVSPYESIKASSNIILMKDKTAYSVIKLKDDKIIKVTYPKIDTLKR